MRKLWLWLRFGFGGRGVPSRLKRKPHTFACEQWFKAQSFLPLDAETEFLGAVGGEMQGKGQMMRSDETEIHATLCDTMQMDAMVFGPTGGT